MDNKITLRDFLEQLEFSYKILSKDAPGEKAHREKLISEGSLLEDDADKDLLCLVDTTGANLANIESERFPVNKDTIPFIVDRLSTYIDDYFVKDFKDDLQLNGFSTTMMDFMTLEEICTVAERAKFTVSPYIKAVVAPSEYIVF